MNHKKKKKKKVQARILKVILSLQPCDVILGFWLQLLFLFSEKSYFLFNNSTNI